MKLTKAKGLPFVLATILGMLGAERANATVTYSYVGYDYTTIYGSGFNSGENVTLSFTVNSPLPENFSGFITPVSFTASDGLNTISSPTDTSASFDIVTIGGRITGWEIYLTYTNWTGNYDTSTSYTIYTSTGLNGSGFTDQGYFYGCPYENCEEQYAGNNYNTPGKWTSSAAIPEPSTWAMMLLGFAGLGFARNHQLGKSRR